MTGPFPFSRTETRLLAAVLDELVPASSDGGRVPAAGALGVAEFIAGKATASPDLAALLRDALQRIVCLAETRGGEFASLDRASRVSIVAALEREAPEVFAALLRNTYMGYYSRADVRPLLGLSPGPTQPEGYAVPDDDPGELASLLAPVRARGRCYRPS